MISDRKTTESLDKCRDFAVQKEFYFALQDDLIRDMLVIGTKDRAARASIFRQATCDFKSAFNTLQISETAGRQLKGLPNEQ